MPVRCSFRKHDCARGGGPIARSSQRVLMLSTERSFASGTTPLVLVAFNFCAARNCHWREHQRGVGYSQLFLQRNFKFRSPFQWPSKAAAVVECATLPCAAAAHIREAQAPGRAAAESDQRGTAAAWLGASLNGRPSVNLKARAKGGRVPTG